MSNKDKAQEKLIASIRKTQQDSKVKSKGEKVNAKSTVKSRTVIAKVAKKQERSESKKIMPHKNNGYYQSSNRVWPD